MNSETRSHSALEPSGSLADLVPQCSPALLTAQSLVATEPKRAAECVEAHFATLRCNKDLTPWIALVLAVSGRIHSLSCFEALDPFIEFYNDHREALIASPQVAQKVDVAYFGALVFRDLAHSETPRMAAIALEITQSGSEPLIQLEAANYLLLYRIWTGDLLGADVLRQQMIPLREQCHDVNTRLLSHSLSAMSLRLFLNYQACHEELQQGLELGKLHNIHFWDSHLHMQGAFLALSQENLHEAQQYLKKMLTASPSDAYLDRSGYHYLCAWRHMIQGERTLSLAQAQESVRLAEQSGARFPIAVTHMGLAQAYLELKHRGRALKHIVRARRITRRMPGNSAMAFAQGLAQASLCFKFDMHQRGIKILSKALTIGRQQRYLNFPWWRGEHMSTLCAHALNNDLERDYILWMIQKRRLRPPPGVRDWYWPLTIRVLGTPRFRLDGQALTLGTRAEEILVSLVILGARDKLVDRTRLLDRLWPDSEGDRAERALDTAVHRLRRQLGCEAAIITQPGSLALNWQLCRVDYWILLDQLKKPNLDDIPALLDAIGTIAYLPSPINELLPVTSLRRRLFQSVVELLEDEPTDLAQDQLETLVECMPEQERAWQALIRGYVILQLPSAALDAWQRAYAALIKHNNVEPGPATRALVEPGLTHYRSKAADQP